MREGCTCTAFTSKPCASGESLDPLPVTRARTDKSHNGLHYFHQKSRDGELRQQMALFSNEVGPVLLQVLFNAICNGHMQTALQATGAATGNAGM